MRIIAVLGTVLTVSGLGCFLYRQPFSEDKLCSIASAYVSVSVTMLGFMLAILGILVSLQDRRLMRNMSRTGHYRVLLSHLYSTAVWYGATMLFAMIALFTEASWLAGLVSLASGAMIGSSIELFSASLKLRAVLQALLPKEGEPLE